MTHTKQHWWQKYRFESNFTGILLLIVLFAIIGLPILYVIVKVITWVSANIL